MRSQILIRYKVSHRLVSVSPAVRLIEGKESYHSVLAGFLKAALFLFMVLDECQICYKHHTIVEHQQYRSNVIFNAATKHPSSEVSGHCLSLCFPLPTSRRA